MKLRTKFLILILIIILAVFLLNYFQKELRSFFYSISSSSQKVLWRAGDSTSDFFNGVVRIKTLDSETDQLKLKNQELLAEIIALKGLERENETLRRALEIDLEKDFKLILGQIIGKDISSDFILIDKGESDGVSKDMPVITEERVILGKVSEVYNKYSKIMLLTSKKSSFDAKIFSPEKEEKNISGIVKGKNNLKVFLELVSKDEDISQGDLVITTKMGGVFPDNLLVGQIKEIRKKDIESFQQAEIKPAFSINDLNHLFIITDY